MKTLVISAFLWAPLAIAEVGTIEKVGIGSTVKVQRAGAVVRLKAGDDLKSGDEVSTDASTAVDIRLEDETLIRLGVNSSYKVQEDSKIHALVHRLLSGVVRVLVKPTDRDHTDPHIKFRMLTQEGTIGVRGTEFVVTRTNSGTELKGLDGEVLFGAAETELSNTANLQMVTRGFQSSISAGAKMASKPEKFDLKKYLDNVNAKSNASFGALTGGGSAAKAARYERAAVAAPVAMQVMPKSSSTSAASIPTPKQAPVVAKVVKPDQDSLQLALVNAVLDSNLAKVRAAFEAGARANLRLKDTDVTPLQAALTADKKVDMEIFTELFLHGADANADVALNLTPLMFAATHKINMDYVRALVDPGGADYTAVNDKGETAESIAIATGYTQMVAYLQSKEIVKDYQKAADAIEAKGKKAAK